MVRAAITRDNHKNRLDIGSCIFLYDLARHTAVQFQKSTKLI